MLAFVAALATGPVVATQTAPAPFDPKAALAELVADDTTPERRGELSARLSTTAFAAFGTELARELGKSSGTEPERRPVFGMVEGIWNQHLRLSLDDDEVQVLWQILDEPSFGSARYLAVGELLRSRRPDRADVAEIAARIDRLARVDVDPGFRAACIASLVQAVSADGYVIPAVEVAKSSGQPRLELGLLLQTKVLDHIPHLAPLSRKQLMQYVSGLRLRLDNPNDRRQLDHAFAYAHDISLWEWAQHSHVCLQQHRLVQRGVGAGEVGSTTTTEPDPIALESRGTFDLDWESLAPFAPAKWPVQVGEQWMVAARLTPTRGASLGCVMPPPGTVVLHAKAFGEKLLQIVWNDRNAGTAWGSAMAERQRAKLQGALTVTVERRGRELGCAVVGELVAIVAKPAEGPLAGPDAARCKLSSRETHQIAIWLPLDETGRFTSFELRDDVAITGNYGTEPFTAKLTFASSPGPVWSHEEQRQAEKLIVAATNGDAAAGRKLVAFGVAVAPQLAEAIEQASDFDVKRRMTVFLRRIMAKRLFY